MWLLKTDGDGDTVPSILINIETGAEIRLKRPEKSDGGTIVFIRAYNPGAGTGGLEAMIGSYLPFEEAAQVFKSIAKELKARDASKPALDVIE